MLFELLFAFATTGGWLSTVDPQFGQNLSLFASWVPQLVQ
jgi:hypothetical protein